MVDRWTDRPATCPQDPVAKRPVYVPFHGQRLRWAEGNLSILAYDNPLFMRGLDLRQRLTYFASIIHWASGFPTRSLGHLRTCEKECPPRRIVRIVTK